MFNGAGLAQTAGHVSPRILEVIINSKWRPSKRSLELFGEMRRVCHHSFWMYIAGVKLKILR